MFKNYVPNASFFLGACACSFWLLTGCASDSTTDSSTSGEKSTSTTTGSGNGGSGGVGTGAGGKGTGGTAGIGGMGAGGKGAGGTEGTGGKGAGGTAGTGGMGAGGASAVACTGSGDSVCGSKGFCDVGTKTCGGAGICVPRPSGCNKDCPKVCGCDGMTYCNTCLANVAGVAVADDAVCATSGEYSAQYIPTKGVDVIVVGRKDVASKVCIRARLESPAPLANIAYKITAPSGWGLKSLTVSSSLADCDNLALPIAGKSGPAGKASGTFKWKLAVGKTIPCMLSGTVQLSFNQQPYTMDPSMVPVINGCK